MADSSANLFSLEGASFASVPLRIVNEEYEFVDNETLDVQDMVEKLGAYKGKTGTSCPNVADWLEAFGGSEAVFALCITSNLSGAWNAAVQAAREYMADHPERRVCVLDSLSTGPELALIASRLAELSRAGLEFEQIERQIRDYMTTTHLLFMLESVDNLAKNGRCSPVIAKAVGFLGIRIVGRASQEGTLQQLHKCRNERRGMEEVLRELENLGYHGGRVQIAHVFNASAAGKLGAMIRAKWDRAAVEIVPTGGLCSFYAERGGLLIGFEGK